MKIHLFILLLFVSFYLVCAQDEDTINNAIYEPVNAVACVRRLYYNGSIGCQSPSSGVSGSLRPILNDEDLNEFIKQPIKSILALSFVYFNRSVLELLLDTKKVQGILVLDDPSFDPLYHFSPASIFPNQPYGLHPESSYEWNPTGQNLIYENFNIPIYAVNASDSYKIANYSRENANNENAPQWGAQLSSFMWATSNSQKCLLRGYCDPVGGETVWGGFHPLDDKKDIIMLITAQDALGFFQQLAPGADAALSGLISTVATLEALGHSNSSEQLFNGNLDKQLLFSLFDVESWGYIGSKKFVQDFENDIKISIQQSRDSRGEDSPLLNTRDTHEGTKKSPLGKISGIINLSQVGHPLDENDPQLYIHQERANTQNNQPLYSALLSAASLEDYPSGVKLLTNVSSETPGIPPSSLMSFLLQQPSLAGVVLADHSGPYTNLDYGSRFDGLLNVNQLLVCDLSTIVARALLLLLDPSTSNTTLLGVNANCSLVSELFVCLAGTYNCSLINQFLPPDDDLPVIPSNYGGVYGYTRIPTEFLNNFLSYTLRNASSGSCNSNKDCESEFSCINSLCVTANVFINDAISPAFSPDRDTYKIVNNSAALPLWTESTWSGITISVFKMENQWVSGMILGIGVAEFFAFLVIFYVALQNYLS